MIATLYQLPAWFYTSTDKPDANTFVEAFENASMWSAEVKTLEQPTAFKIIVRVQSTNTGGTMQDNWTSMNYVYIDELTLWYKVTTVKVVQWTPTPTFDVEGEVDVYLSFMIDYFNPLDANVRTEPVYFNQKHLNRYMYENNQPVINYQQQFYLM